MKENSQDAFAALVGRHLNLVYSAALRQVRSPQLAEEVAQSVFADLAHEAAKLKPDTIVTAWLYQVTRRTAIDVVRRESRRQLREQIAVEMNAMNATTADWKDIEPMLDEAVSALGDSDRTAILLRYFENKSLRDVGRQLGVSDDAAQKRVSRAVEQLREFLAKRGLAIGASALVVIVSANAVQAAPAGLALTIPAVALTGTTVHTSAALTATKVIAMTTLQKTFVAASIAILAGTAIFEAHKSSQLNDQLKAFSRQQSALTDQLQVLQRERNEAVRQNEETTAENALLKSNANQAALEKQRQEAGLVSQTESVPVVSEAMETAKRIDQIKEWLGQTPDQQIPELKFVSLSTWVSYLTADQHWQGTTNDFKFILGNLRTAAKERVSPLIGQALDDYLVAYNGRLPDDLTQLSPYLATNRDSANRRGNDYPEIDYAILQRYQLTHSGNITDFPQNEPFIVEKSPIQDGQYDAIFKIGINKCSYDAVNALGASGSSPMNSEAIQKLKALYGN